MSYCATLDSPTNCPLRILQHFTPLPARHHLHPTHHHHHHHHPEATMQSHCLPPMSLSPCSILAGACTSSVISSHFVHMLLFAAHSSRHTLIENTTTTKYKTSPGLQSHFKSRQRGLPWVLVTAARRCRRCCCCRE